MKTNIITVPRQDEYAAFYAGYVALVPTTENIIVTLERQASDTVQTLKGLSDGQGMFRYAPNKWSVKEIVGHITDTERIFAYRALRIARRDATPLPGFEQDDYVRVADFDKRELTDLTREFEVVRAASVHLLRSFDEAAWQQRGTASEREITVRALAFIIAGHERHHIKILHERYLQTASFTDI